MQEKSMVKSAFILTVGNVVSKIIGVLYVFLFSYLVSSRGLALYSYAYIPYVIFLDLATLGIPIGVMKLISFYNEEEKLDFSYYLYKKIRLISFGLGLVMFMIMFSISDQLASLILAGEESITNNVRDVSNVIKLVSLALIVIPNLALLRGIFNSLKQTKETAMSQIIEQLIRVSLILLSSFIVINLLGLSYVFAIYLAVLAAMVSGLVSYTMLVIRYHKLISEVKARATSTQFTFDVKGLLKTLWLYALPAVMITLLISLYAMVDTLTINRAFLAYQLENSEIVYATYAFEVNKLIMLPTVLGASFGMSLIVYAKEKGTNINFNYFNALMIKACQTLVFFITPVMIIFMTFHKAVYNSLYSYQNPYGPTILFTAAPLIILYSLVNMTSGIMQSIKLEWTLVISLLFGVCLKLLYNISLIGQYELRGAILATYIGLFITLLINFGAIKRRTNFSYVFLVRRLLAMIVLASGLGLLFYFINFTVIDFNLDPSNRLMTLLFLVINGIMYGLSYLIGCYYLGITDIIFGSEFEFKKLVRYLNIKTTIKRWNNML